MALRTLIAFAFVTGVVAPSGAAFAQTACPGTRFVSATPILGGGPVPDALVLTSDEPQQLVRWTCGAGETVVRVRTKGTRVRATWLACGTHTRVRLRATIDSTCTTMVGKVKAQGEHRVAFVAQAEACVLEPSSPTAVFLDCAYGQSASRAPNAGTPALRVVSIYESRSDHSFNYHPYGQASVQVDDAGPTVLFLHSYEPTNFVVQAGAGAVLSDVIAEGYYTPGLNLPLGVAGELHSYELGNEIDVDCSDWSDTNGAPCINDVEPQRLLEYTGLCVASHDGCYRATQIELP